MHTDLTKRLYTLDEIAEFLRIDGKDKIRSVKRIIDNLKATYRKRGKTILLTESDLINLLEKMKCSHSEKEVNISTSAVQSVVVKKSAKSPSTLLDAATKALQKNIKQN